MNSSAHLSAGRTYYKRAFSLTRGVMAHTGLHQREPTKHTQEPSVSSGVGVQKRMLFIFTPPALVNSECRLTSTGNCNDIYTHHAQSLSPWEFSNTCKTTVEKEQWMNVNFSQCFLQPLISTRACLSPALPHKCFTVSWHADHLG